MVVLVDFLLIVLSLMPLPFLVINELELNLSWVSPWQSILLKLGLVNRFHYGFEKLGVKGPNLWEPIGLVWLNPWVGPCFGL